MSFQNKSSEIVNVFQNTFFLSVCSMYFLFHHNYDCFLVSLKAPLEHNSEMSLSESGFDSGGKRNFLQLTDKDGEQPQIASVTDDLCQQKTLVP